MKQQCIFVFVNTLNLPDAQKIFRSLVKWNYALAYTHNKYVIAMKCLQDIWAMNQNNFY